MAVCRSTNVQGLWVIPGPFLFSGNKDYIEGVSGQVVVIFGFFHNRCLRL